MLKQETTTWKEKVARTDPLGTFFFLPSIVCLLLALQWGGVTYSWSNARIVALLVLGGVRFVAFVLVQRFNKQKHSRRLLVLLL